MSLDNNKTAIIKNWKNKFEKTKNPYWARCVFEATGEEPDHEMANYLGTTRESPDMTEDELIEDSIKNPNHIF